MMQACYGVNGWKYDRNLNIQKEFADDPRSKPPAALCVLCGMANAAYRRPDGVFVVPITALKP